MAPQPQSICREHSSIGQKDPMPRKRDTQSSGAPNHAFGTLFAELYDIAFQWDRTAELATLFFLWDALLPRPPYDVCDLGAGTGHFSVPLVEAGLECTAVEPDPAMAQILIKRAKALPLKKRKLLTIWPHELTTASCEGRFDSVIAMTDTISYIWPLRRLSTLLRHIRFVLKAGGVLLIDVSLWNGHEGESRQEAWQLSRKQETGYARCTAQIARLDNASPADTQLVRVEELGFERFDAGNRHSAIHQSLLHAFSSNTLRSLLTQAGFSFGLCAVPGTMLRVDDTENHPRLVMGFVRTSDK